MHQSAWSPVKLQFSTCQCALTVALIPSVSGPVLLSVYVPPRELSGLPQMWKQIINGCFYSVFSSQKHQFPDTKTLSGTHQAEQPLKWGDDNLAGTRVAGAAQSTETWSFQQSQLTFVHLSLIWGGLGFFSPSLVCLFWFCLFGCNCCFLSICCLLWFFLKCFPTWGSHGALAEHKHHCPCTHRAVRPMGG